MKKLRYILLSLIWGISLWGQSPQVGTDAYSTEPPQRLSPYEKADKALAEGRYTEVEDWYHQLSKRNRAKAEYLYLATLSSINSYQIELAEERLAAYTKLRLKGEEALAARSAVKAHLDKVTRLLSNTRTVVTNDTLLATEAEAMQLLGRYASHLGVVTKESYTSPDGKSSWQVGLDADSLPAFWVYHQLGDGSWDRAHPDIISVSGLPDGAEISYPFLMSDGITLYFSVTEEGLAPEHTLGGSDIYVSRYDREGQSLLVPTQLSLPFNSSSDDYCYILDEERDLGWMLSNRGTPHGLVRLYTFTPSTLARYEGEEVAEIARWLTPSLQPREMKEVSSSGTSGSRERVLFWIGERPIYSAEDLLNSTARTILTEYLKIEEAMQHNHQRLEELRDRMHRDRSITNDPQIKAQVLKLEEQEEAYRKHLTALRNEVIKQSGLGQS